MPELKNTEAPELIRKHVAAMLEVQDELDAQKIANMNKCREIREGFTRKLDMADAEGLSKKKVKALFKIELLKRDAEKLSERRDNIVDAFEDDDAETFELYLEAMGDFAGTPLGAAAAPPEKKKTAAEKNAEKNAISREQLGELADRLN